MITQNIALFNWSNGVIMIAVFGLVCLLLIGYLVKFMAGGSKNNDEPKER